MRASQLPTARLSTRIGAEETATTRSQRQPAPTRVLDRYELRRRLGSGGFGTVWLARDERLEREVAVKLVPGERVVGGRLEREARAAARLSHPGIVTLYEAAVDADAAYLVSELVRGPTLAELLEAGRLSDLDIVEIGVAMCDALAYAHSQGVVHRDVKPSNILVPDQPSSRAGIAKLTDFGVALVIGGDSLTRTGDVLGTAAYMAPEQALGREAGPPADLFSLALVVYEALTGMNPVRATPAAQRARRLGAYLPPLRRQRRDLPRELGRAVDLALRPKPRERGTIDELRAALQEALETVGDTPGIVTGPWPGRQAAPAPAPAREHDLDEPFAPSPAGAPEGPQSEEPEGRKHRPIPRSARALAGVAAGAGSAWVFGHALTGPPAAPLAVGVVTAMVVALLPRLGWLAAVASLAAGLSAQGRPGAAVLLALAWLLPVPLLLFDGVAWPLPAGAPALGLIGLAGAWPALAARTGGPWRRLVLGGCGWVWLVLLSPIAGFGLYLGLPNGVPTLPVWSGSLSQTIDLVLRPLLSSGALAAAPVWAVAALILPWLVRGRSLAVDIVLATAWAAAVASATITAIKLVHPGPVPLADATAVIGAIVSALVALAPGLLRAARVQS